jgi:hypothetical protein
MSGACPKHFLYQTKDMLQVQKSDVQKFEDKVGACSSCWSTHTLPFCLCEALRLPDSRTCFKSMKLRLRASDALLGARVHPGVRTLGNSSKLKYASLAVFQISALGLTTKHNYIP